MATDIYSILTIAARVYDKDTLSPRDEAFLDAINKAGQDHSDAIAHAAIHYGQGTDVWEAVMRLSTRQRDADYANALAVFEARDEAAADAPTAEFLENILAPLNWSPRTQAAE